jgi:transketolase C-terminal domain/subunit
MLDKGAMAPRRAYGVALRPGHVYPHLVALDADVRNSTYSETFVHDEELRERFFECRIAEQNMLSRGGCRRSASCRLSRPLVNFWCEPTISWRWPY